MTSISIPSTVMTIGASAFYATNSLTSLNFAPDSKLFSIRLKAIEATKWYSCLPNGPVYVGNLLYGYKGTMPANTSITVKDGTFAIMERAFENCSNLTNIIIPDSVCAISEYALDGTSWLDNQPNGLVYAGKVVYTFKGLMSLDQHIELNEDTSGIAGGAFNDCDLMTSISIPDGVAYVGPYAFNYTKLLRSIKLPAGLKYIDQQAFKGSYFKACCLPSGIEYIGLCAFEDNHGMPTITFADGYSYNIITERMFDTAWNLESIVLPDCTVKIEDQAFFQCFSLKSITIPRSVTLFGTGLFYEWTGLTIYCYENSPAQKYAQEQSIKYVLLDDEETVADYSGVYTALRKADAVVRNFYTPESLAVLDAAVNAVEYNLRITRQQAVNAFAASINSAIDTLVYRPADYYAVGLAIAAAQKVERPLFTEESLLSLDAALNSVVFNLDITCQSEVTTYAKSINDAVNMLQYKPADYTIVNLAVSRAQAIDADLFTNASMTALRQSVSCVNYSLNITQQSTVDGYAERIDAAINLLVYDSVTLRNEVHNIIVSATTRELKKNSELAVDKKDASEHEGSNFAVGGTIKSMNFYDINVMFSRETVQPDGTVTVKIKLSDGVTASKCKVYHVTNDIVEPLVRCASTIDGDYIVFETDHFSEFAVIEVEKVLDSIRIAHEPYKTVYAQNSPIGLGGLDIRALFSDSTEEVITDYEVGMVDMSKAGTKNVTVYYTYGNITKTAYFQIIVEQSVTTVAAERVEITVPSSTLSYKKSAQCLLTVYPQNASDYTVVWSSSNTQIVSVDQGGKITAIGKGNATINAAITNADGSKIVSSVNISCTMTIWQRILKFFQSIFGITINAVRV